MTEDEAKQKRCCVYGGGAPAWVANPKSGNLSPLTVWMCIGSECMAWRWVYSSDGWTHRKPTGEPFTACTMGALAEAEQKGYSRCGYCGLAGAP